MALSMPTLNGVSNNVEGINQKEWKEFHYMSMIEMKDVVKKYDNGTTALLGVSVQIEPGEFAYIVGPSGAGKSTFIRLFIPWSQTR